MSEPKSYVSWTIFNWTVSIIIVLFGVMFTSLRALEAKIESATKDNTEIKIKLSKIETDVLWIREKLTEK